MFEITARLLRNQSSVFLCGETVEVFVTISNHSLPEHRISQSNIDAMEHLAWGSVQINGYCKTQHKIKEPVQSLPKTSLNVHENSILSTEPKILFCDLRLANGESRTYYYREQLPPNCPPTYKGIDIKYYYKVTVATQRLGSKVQLLQVPIRVLPLFNIEDKVEPIPAQGDDITNEELTPTNPFLENDRKVVSKVEIALETLQNITARRRPNFYIITNRRGKIGRFCLFKPSYKLGEDIVGSLDFSCRSVRCVQLSVTLQCEEILLRNTPKSPVSDKESKSSTGKVTNFTKHHEICVGLLQTQMILPIPLHVTPSFTTDLVDVRWRLHFQFVTTTSNELMPVDGPTEENWNGPKSIDIETMVWNLPINIHSTNPTQIFQPQLLN
ncbi:RAB6A-GEF complex partner protein 2 [Chironomus tepperi]|uniref:RAB6A-GEF complex partner protein 2 n=1 Tax=Chironomus tepperi TaxID=113505 RepID=UPI00391F5AAA